MITIYTYNGQVLIEASTGMWFTADAQLQPNTIRVRTSDGQPPINEYSTFETATLVPGTTDVYDVYKSGTSFSEILSDSTNVVEIIAANITNITNMYYAFAGCKSLTTVSLFDTSSVTTMEGMFYGCSSLSTVPLFDTSSVTDMIRMFFGCKTLATVPLFDTSSVTDMIGMFFGCKTLATVPLFDTSSVTDMLHTFRECTSLVSVPLFNTSNVTRMAGTFYECTSLISVPLFDTSNVTDMQDTFYHCYVVESGALALYRQASTQANPPQYHTQTFYRCGRDTTTGAAELAQIPSDWK